MEEDKTKVREKTNAVQKAAAEAAANIRAKAEAESGKKERP